MMNFTKCAVSTAPHELEAHGIWRTKDSASKGNDIIDDDDSEGEDDESKNKQAGKDEKDPWKFRRGARP